MKKFFKKKVRKQKYDRRRAMKCVLLEKSRTHEGYCKYEVTIGEKDGTVHKQPAYGTDMQDALSRLINTERTVKIEKKLEILLKVRLVILIQCIIDLKFYTF